MPWNKIILLLVLLSNVFACVSVNKTNKPNQLPFFVGTSTNLPTEGIYAYILDVATGKCTFQSKTENIINPSFLAISPRNQFLYALERVEGVSENGVKAYAIGEKGNLTLINQRSTKGKGACYISVDRLGKNALIAHYSSGSVVNLPINSDGSLEEVVDLIQHEGSSINKERQEGPHAHYIRQGLDDKIYAVDLGTDKIMLYELKNGRLQASHPIHLKAVPGAGPRHIDYHPNGKFVYVMNEMGGSVSVFRYDEQLKTFEIQQTISSLPTAFEGFNKSADIHVHPSGNFLYASNRGDYDSIAAFKIDTETGKLALVEIERETIVWPRNFAISPDGNYLLCANLKDDSISVFEINQETGALDFTGQQIAVPKPLCIQFLKDSYYSVN